LRARASTASARVSKRAGSAAASTGSATATAVSGGLPRGTSFASSRAGHGLSSSGQAGARSGRAPDQSSSATEVNGTPRARARPRSARGRTGPRDHLRDACLEHGLAEAQRVAAAPALGRAASRSARASARARRACRAGSKQPATRVRVEGLDLHAQQVRGGARVQGLGGMRLHGRSLIDETTLIKYWNCARVGEKRRRSR
jgi:hypothetical protein